jgi:phosphoribosylaminoimidazole-succinocarboxamide synthase
MTVTTLYPGRERAIPGLRFVASGKVRDIYEIDAERLLFVTTDRVSAFDVVMAEAIPHKGEVLTRIAAWWFERTRDIVANHFLSSDVDLVPRLPREWKERLRGRVMIVKRAEPTPVEWVVRGYLAGSGWREYQRARTVCGIPLPGGLQLASRLPSPLLTPTTKEATHDRPLSPAEARELVGGETFDRAERAALALFARGSEILARHGILLADTKFEFGLVGRDLILIDEALTPDSSRFWPARSWKPGANPPSYDKQVLRDWLEAQPWNKAPPPPSLSARVIEETSAKYLEICRELTGWSPAGAVR